MVKEVDACGETCLRKNLYLRFFATKNTQIDEEELDGCIIYSLIPNDWQIELDNKYITPISYNAIYLPKGRKHKLIPGVGSLFLHILKGSC